MTDYPPQDPREAKQQYEQALQHQDSALPPQSTRFSEELEAARVRLYLPNEATAWQIMNAAAESEREARALLQSLLGI